MDICKKCGEVPRLSAVCELQAMAGRGIVCAVTREVVPGDKRK